MDAEPEPGGDGGDSETAGSDGPSVACETALGESVANASVADASVADAVGPAADRERELQDVADREREISDAADRDTADRERRLRDLVAEAGFAGTFSALAGLARRWSEHPEVDARAAAELRLLGRRLDALAQDVGTSARLR